MGMLEEDRPWPLDAIVWNGYQGNENIGKTR